jgi:hypothetical protein
LRETDNYRPLLTFAGAFILTAGGFNARLNFVSALPLEL